MTDDAILKFLRNYNLACYFTLSPLAYERTASLQVFACFFISNLLTFPSFLLTLLTGYLITHLL